MTGVDRFSRRDWFWAIAAFSIALALRIPLRSHFAYFWDSAQFALAIEHYDLAASLPHPPGYFLYVMLGRALNLFIQEPHTTLVWLSIFAGSILPALSYLLGAAKIGRAHV